MLCLGFAREMFKRHLFISYVSAGNKIQCHGQCCWQAMSSMALLYKTTFSGSDSVMWSDGTVNEQWIRKVMEGSSCELISDTVLVFAWRAWGTHQNSLLVAEIWTQDFQCTKQECCVAVCDVWCFLTGMNKRHIWVSVSWMCELEALTRIYDCFFLLSPFMCMYIAKTKFVWWKIHGSCAALFNDAVSC